MGGQPARGDWPNFRRRHLRCAKVTINSRLRAFSAHGHRSATLPDRCSSLPHRPQPFPIVRQPKIAVPQLINALPQPIIELHQGIITAPQRIFVHPQPIHLRSRTSGANPALAARSRQPAIDCAKKFSSAINSAQRVSTSQEPNRGTEDADAAEHEKWLCEGVDDRLLGIRGE